MRLRCASLVVMAVVACDRGPTEVSVQLESVAADAIVVRVETASDVSIALCDDGCERVAPDGAGRASLRVPVPADGNLSDAMRDGQVEVVAIRDDWFGSEIVGTATLQLPFYPGSLPHMPKNPEGSWMYVLTTDSSDTLSACFGVRPADGSKLGVPAEIVDARSATISGPPGASVQLGGRTFTIDATGTHSWTPTAELVEALFPAPGAVATAVRVEAPGQAPRTFELELELMNACRRLVGDAIRSRVTAREPSKDPVRDIGVVVRADGPILVLGEWRDADRWRSARYVAIEDEESRTTGSVCSQRNESPRPREPGFVDVYHVDVTPQRISTRLTLYRLPEYDVVATTVLPPDPGPEPCEERVEPSEHTVRAWIEAQVPKLDSSTPKAKVPS